MNEHKIGATFDYVLFLNGVDATEFVNWTTECTLRDFNGKLITVVPSEWVNPAAPVAVSLLVLDTSNWRPGAAWLDVKFTSPGGYVRILKDPVQWEFER